jgi:hypothetical protein
VQALTPPVTAIVAGDLYTCGLTDGSPYCRGRNESGQLGNGTSINSPVPVRVEF